MERVKGIEPSSQPWEGHILPLNHTRAQEDKKSCITRRGKINSAFYHKFF